MTVLNKVKIRNVNFFKPVFAGGSVVCSLLVSACIAFLTRKIHFDQVYQDLVVGSITWSGSSKSVDYYMVVVFLISYIVLLFLINVFLHLFSKSTQAKCTNAQKGDEDFSLNAKILLTAAIPAGWCLGASQPIPEYLMFSVGAILLGGALIMYVYPRFHAEVKQKQLMDIYIATLMIVVLSFFALLSLTTFIVHTIGISFRLNYSIGIAFPIIVLLLIIALYSVSQTAELLKERLVHLLFWLQLPLPFLLFILIPFPHAQAQSNIIFYTALLTVIIICFYSWYRQRSLWIKTKSRHAYAIDSGLVGSAIVCILIFILRTAPTPPSDDYHFGEWLLPWQQLLEFGKIPFVDLNYPHGMLHLIHGFIAWLFFDGTAASFGMAGVILLAIGVAVNYFALSASFGSLVGLLIMVTFPYMSIAGQKYLFIVPSLLILMHPRILDRATLWLMTWLLLSFLLVCYSPSTGSAFALATIPAAVWVTLQTQDGLSRHKWPFLVVPLILLVAMGFTTIGDVIRGMIVFLLENSEINTVANGIPWKSSFEGSIGLIWIIVICGLIVLLWMESAKSKPIRNRRGVLFGGTVVCFLLAMVPYSFGRIDGGVSRPGDLSLWAIYFGLPLTVLLLKRSSGINYVLMVFPVVAASIYAFNVEEGFHNVKSLMDRAGAISGIMTTQAGAADKVSELPNLGRYPIRHEHLKELLELKKVLAKLLRPGETYLDLTNRSARYYYLGYPVPAPEAAFYNAPATKTQLRILEQIKREPPPVVLAESGNIYHDGGPASLRSNLLYRYFVLSYVPLKYGNFILLIKQERANAIEFDPSLRKKIRLCHQEGNSPNEYNRENCLSLLDSPFRVEHLRWIPVSWGRSWKKLSPLLRGVGRVDSNRPMRMIDAKKNTRKGTYNIIANHPQLIFDTSPLKLTGSKAAFVSFDYRLGQSSPPRTRELEIRWKTLDGAPDEKNYVRFYAADTKVLVPLDCNPRWLLSDGIGELKIGLRNCQGCKIFSISNIEFHERNQQ